MDRELLFTRKYNKEEYKFYLIKGIGVFGIYSEYIEVETPENCFGYPDYVRFNHGNPYTSWRYLQPWIMRKITEALVKKGYECYMQQKEEFQYEYY